MGRETHYELARRSINISKNEETTLSWDSSPLAVRSDKGIYFYQFSFNIHCTEKCMDFLETAIICPKSSPAKSLFTSDYFRRKKSNIETTEMILDPSLWPHNDRLTQEMVNVRSMKWAPKGFFGNSETTLAILNDIGGIELFALQRSVWTSIFDFSPFLQQYFAEQTKPIQNFQQLREAVYTIEPCAICWASDTIDNISYFVTAQKNSKILFWCLNSKESNISAQVVGETQCNISEIISMIWIPKSDAGFWLICSDMLGQIIALECQKENNGISCVQYHSLWPHKDKMVANHLQYAIINDRIILICNKYRHLLVLMFDKKFNKLSQYLDNVNDYRITDICKTTDGIYLSTINTRIYKVNMDVKDISITVSLDLFETKDIYPTYELYGISFSPNGKLCALGLIDTKICSRKKTVLIEVVFLSSDRKIDSIIPTLLKNPSEKLTDFWDCLEILRCRAMKLCNMPTFDYNSLYLHENTDVPKDVYKLKLYLIFIILFKNLRQRFKMSTQEPTVLSEEIVREQILAHQASKCSTTIADNFKNNGMLCDFEKESLHGVRKYLEYFNKKHNSHVNLIEIDLLPAKCKFEYVCQSCNEILDGFSCKNDHRNMFCSLTFTPIQGLDYLVCKSCNATARVELYTDKPMCVYCDLYLNLI